MAKLQLCALPGGDLGPVLAFVEELGERADAQQDLALLLYQVSGDREHIARAKRILEETLRRVPADHHEGMLVNIRNNREVVAAWQREFGAGTEDDAASPWSEQETEGW